MSNPLKIENNMVVTIQYSLINNDGTLIRDAERDPVTYLHGTGRIPPRLEQALMSHVTGDTLTVRLLPEDAFGVRDEELVQDIPLEEIPGHAKLEVGSRIVGTDQDGVEVTFTVTAIDNGMASLDGNHPLAGQILIFDVEVLAVRPATDDETEQGSAGNMLN